MTLDILYSPCSKPQSKKHWILWVPAVFFSLIWEVSKPKVQDILYIDRIIFWNRVTEWTFSLQQHNSAVCLKKKNTRSEESFWLSHYNWCTLLCNTSKTYFWCLERTKNPKSLARLDNYVLHFGAGCES